MTSGTRRNVSRTLQVALAYLPAADGLVANSVPSVSRSIGSPGRFARYGVFTCRVRDTFRRPGVRSDASDGGGVSRRGEDCGRGVHAIGSERAPICERCIQHHEECSREDETAPQNRDRADRLQGDRREHERDALEEHRELELDEYGLG